ncbi:MAG: prolipoprotein diacylglyceryl transferase [Limisphaerales bacterium]
MCPELFHIGPFALRTYGLTLAASFFIGLFFIRRWGAKEGLDVNQLSNLAFLVIATGIVGARLGYVLFHLEEFKGNWGATFNPFQSGTFGIAGLNLYTGVILATGSGFYYMHKVNLPFWKTADIFAPTVTLGIFLTRIGCFLNGCCYGTPTHLPWGITFPPGSIPDAEFRNQAIHPAQLYHSLFGLALFALLIWSNKRKKFDGATFSILLLSEPVFRFFIEFIRSYEPEMHLNVGALHWTYNQWMAILLFAFGMVLWLKLRKRANLSPIHYK